MWIRIATIGDHARAVAKAEPPIRVFDFRSLEDRSRQQLPGYPGQYAFKFFSRNVPEFDDIGEFLGSGGLTACTPGFFGFAHGLASPRV